MSVAVLVVGATGNQGGATVDALLSKGNKFKVFGMTRNPEGGAAKKLKEKGVEPVKADLDDKASVAEAIKSSGAKYMFLVTDYFNGAKNSKAVEIKQGIDCIDAAKENGIEYLVFSSVGDADRCPEAVEHFKSKLEVENYLKPSNLGYTILRPVAFLDNFDSPSMYNPLCKGVAQGFVEPEGKQQYISTRDIGMAAAAVMENPAQWKGITLDCASCEHTGHEVAQALSEASGEECKYNVAFFSHICKWFGWWGLLADLKSMILYLEKEGYHADVAAFKKLVPDAWDARAYFASLGKWSDGTTFKANKPAADSE